MKPLTKFAVYTFVIAMIGMQLEDMGTASLNKRSVQLASIEAKIK